MGKFFSIPISPAKWGSLNKPGNWGIFEIVSKNRKSNNVGKSFITINLAKWGSLDKPGNWGIFKIVLKN